MWAQKFGSPDEPDSLNAVAVDSSNNILVGGCLGLLGNCSPAIAKYDSNGNMIFQQDIQEQGNVYGLTLAGNGDIFVAGDVVAR